MRTPPTRLPVVRPTLVPIAAIIAAALGVACSSDDDGTGDETPPDGVSRTPFSFEEGSSGGWRAGFADYPAGDEDFFELSSGVERLPAPLDGTVGLALNGSNRSDDLFMYITRRLDGFLPDTRYALDFEITFATDAPSGCVGIGGAPGESVTLKAGATVIEPAAIDDGTGFLSMNIDKGVQSAGGSDAVALGNVANSSDCAEGGADYELKTLDNADMPFTVTTDESGTLWVLFGTDSGFEGVTRLYYVDGLIVASPSP